MKKYYVSPLYYIPMGYAISLINNGSSLDQAYTQTIERFAFYGKRHRKRTPGFDANQLKRHLDKFLATPNAVLTRRSPKR